MKLKVIGCGVFEPELLSLLAASPHEVQFEPLEAGLHETPAKLRETAQERIDAAAADGFDAAALAYGLCGRGTAGLVARGITVVIPRVHDCLTLFLGSREEYRRQFRRHPGTYYITPGWFTHKLGLDQTGRLRAWSLDARDHPRFAELSERFGADAATEIVSFLGSWKRNYTRVAVIDTGCGQSEECLGLAQRIAANLGWSCERLVGDTTMLRELVTGEWDPARFLVLEPGQRSESSGDDQVLVAVSAGGAAPGGPALEALSGFSGGELGARCGLGLGIDAGGTYTDAVVYDFASGSVAAKAKALTTHHDPLIGISEALDRLEQDLLARVDLVALSTTFATNAIVEDSGGQPGCIIMPHDGFDEARIRWPHRAIIGGRMSIGGEELVPFDAEQCRRAVRALLAEGVDCFAVSGYGSVRNPAHELAAREVIAAECDLPVVCGHELSGRLNFINRANTAALNARLLPLIARLLDAAARTLAQRGIRAPLMVVKGDGSLINVQTALQRPVETILSGPAASVLGARHLATDADALVIDVGGTTTDAAIIADGGPQLSAEGARVGGWQTSVEAVRIRTMGLGGDSALDFGADRELFVGPRRAIPLCYLAAISADGVAHTLATIPQRDDAPRTSALSLDFLMPGPMAAHRTLNDDERRLLDALDGAALHRSALARRLGLVSPRLLNTRRMEERGVVQRAALTPTDLLHYTGEFTAWDVAAARAGVEAFAQLYGAAPDEIVRLVWARITRMLALLVIAEELGQEDLEAQAVDSPALRALLERMLAPVQGEPLGLAPRYGRPIVGIGAPAEAFVPALAERLGCQVLIPEHAEVANAIGAIVSHVSASEVVAVRPSEYDAFTVYAPSGRREFESLSEAAAFAAQEAARTARERALAAGAATPRVELRVDRRVGRLATGEEQIIEVSVRATAMGYPAAAAAT
ncbi:MAG: DUF1638 domain-containing protein [Armatimonadota bacterium]